MELVSKSPNAFPAVTVCNLSTFDKRFAQNYIDNVLEINNISYVHNISLIDIKPEMVNNLIKSSITNDSHLSKNDVKTLGYSLEYMLLTCQYNNNDCSSKDFVWRYDFNYGNCYTFNSGFDLNGQKIPIKKISEAGSDKSFKLELFLGDEFYQSEYALNSGARVLIHNQSITPIYQSEGKDVASGYLTNIGVTRSFYTKLSNPYSDCIKEATKIESYDSRYYKAMFEILNMSAYRQKNCLRLCQQEYIKNKCNCLDASLPSIYKNLSFCSSISSIECVEKQRIEYFNNENYTSLCLTDCPMECESVSYLLSTSISRYPSSYYTQYLKNKVNISSKFVNNTFANDNNITKNIVFINVFYDDLTTTYINEIPEINGDSLLGNIGGNLALFAGMSVLSFVEIIELLIQSVLILRNYKKDKKISSFRI